ncbi:MAG TPA: hypothetical protein VKE40_17350 [Gemmataceae bacterium]|nr:hypothetical protein [Gemmataceae bacterium]
MRSAFPTIALTLTALVLLAGTAAGTAVAITSPGVVGVIYAGLATANGALFVRAVEAACKVWVETR